MLRTRFALSSTSLYISLSITSICSSVNASPNTALTASASLPCAFSSFIVGATCSDSHASFVWSVFDLFMGGSMSSPCWWSQYGSMPLTVHHLDTICFTVHGSLWVSLRNPHRSYACCPLTSTSHLTQLLYSGIPDSLSLSYMRPYASDCLEPTASILDPSGVSVNCNCALFPSLFGAS